MKIIRSLFLAIALLVVMPTVAGAVSDSAHVNVLKVAYNAFGNYSYGDCGDAADANLFMRQYPHADLTDAEVVYDYHHAEYYAEDLLEAPGFLGHSVTGWTTVTTKAQFIAGANKYGIEADVDGGRHAVAVIEASAKSVTYVNGGVIFTVSWARWLKWDQGLASDSAINGWNAPGTVEVHFTGDYETSTMTPQIEAVGSTESLEANGFYNDGYTLAGWSTKPDGEGVIYQDGASYHFTASTYLWAVWTPA